MRLIDADKLENIGGGHCECSNCRTVVSTDLALNHKTRYCMGCGARMDEETERATLR